MDGHGHDHAPSDERDLAPPMIVLDNREEPDTLAALHDRLAWSPLNDYATRLTDLYVAINHAFLAKHVTPDHAMMESLVRATIQSKYAEWITDPAPPMQEEPDGRGNRGGAKAKAAAVRRVR